MSQSAVQAQVVAAYLITIQNRLRPVVDQYHEEHGHLYGVLIEEYKHALQLVISELMQNREEGIQQLLCDIKDEAFQYLHKLNVEVVTRDRMTIAAARAHNKPFPKARSAALDALQPLVIALDRLKDAFCLAPAARLLDTIDKVTEQTKSFAESGALQGYVLSDRALDLIRQCSDADLTEYRAKLDARAEDVLYNTPKNYESIIRRTLSVVLDDEDELLLRKKVIALAVEEFTKIIDEPWYTRQSRINKREVKKLHTDQRTAQLTIALTRAYTKFSDNVVQGVKSKMNWEDVAAIVNRSPIK